MALPEYNSSIDDFLSFLNDRDKETVIDFIKFLAFKNNPLLYNLYTAPEDDEPLTDEELKDLAKAEECIKLGETKSHEEVFRELFNK